MCALDVVAAGIPRLRLQRVTNGQVLIEVKDLDGEVKETSHSPCSGIVHLAFAFHVVESDLLLMQIISA